MENHLNYEIDAPGSRMNEVSCTEDDRFLIDISSEQTSGKHFNQIGLSTPQYGKIVMQLIHDQLQDVFLAIKKDFEANYDLVDKADVNKAYCSLSKQITSIKNASAELFSSVGSAEPNVSKPKTQIVVEHAKKTSFLVFKNNKYFSIKANRIAFFYIKNTTVTIITMDEQEYTVDESLDSLQSSLLPEQFFRLNRQYLINFDAIKEVEHYFSRKLFVKLVIPSPEILLVGKERATSFLNWMSQR